MKNEKSYILRLLIAVDQLFNVLLLNGNEDHTISGRVGYRAKKTNKWYWLSLEKIINTLFWFDKNHCRNSIEWDEV
ncbi:hypothetical protein [Colwellia psychrerythraea]|uniref:Uncharacterized protein n=1 Tax=Colwellia psychrerythraea TaxID=28229 RepID=A0A099KQ64_COLPS|nr:hypothetical protein [Colwellia psychrerythraea]KGJ92037.1 hypothetical protein ND2E_3145 [Colwellia psychrerythraea]